MRKFNLLLTLLIVGVLLFPGVVVAKIAEACCGVGPVDLVVEDSPDPACVSTNVTISGNYTVDMYMGIPPPPAYRYDTGVEVKVWYPDGTLLQSDNFTLGTSDNETPKVFTFSKSFHVEKEGTYTYTVRAWADQPVYGLQTTDIVAGNITAELCEIEVEIDIKPGSDPNSINPNSKGVIPVAILSSSSFDAATVDASSAEFGPSGAPPVHMNNPHFDDVDGDGDLDMVLHFWTQECGFSSTDTQGTLTGQLNDGTPFTASDSVNIVPKGKGPK